MTDEIRKIDSEIADAIEAEFNRQSGNLELIASENIVSPAVLEAMGSVLTNKYAEGYPAHRYYGGCECVDIVENLARDRACRIFGAEHANVQPHSGAQANMTVYFAMLKPGDTILGMDLAHGGHLTHGSKVNFSGSFYNFISYGISPDTYTIDYEEVRRIALENKPKMIVAGASAYPREIDFKRFREIADEVSAYLMVDMAHIAGLVAAGLHNNPVKYADFVTTTTHKTLRGPRGGMILCKKEFAKAIDKALFPGVQGGPLMHIIAGKAVCFKEALSDEFKDYQNQIVKNAKVLSDELIKRGYKMLTDGTDNHLMLMDLRGTGITGKSAEELLDAVRITVNKNSIPFDTEKPTITSGIRIGTPALTTRGMKEDEMIEVAECIDLTLKDFENNKEIVLKKVEDLCKRFPIYQ